MGGWEVGIPFVELKIRSVHSCFLTMLIPYSRSTSIDQTGIEDLIKSEDTKKPFSDQKIVELLEDQDIQLARRTVAKYREQLGIAPSSKRKKHY